MPLVCELPPRGSRWYKPARLGRALAYGAFFLTLTVVCVQVHVKTGRNLRKGRQADRAYERALAAYRANPTEANRRAALAAARKVQTVKRHKGAIARWRRAVRRFWEGRNIYRRMPGFGSADPLTGRLLPGKTLPPPPAPPLGASPAQLAQRDVWLHPNMPFVVILLTPLAWLSPQVMLTVVNVLKILALVGAILAAAAVANHGRGRMGEWVAGLGVLFALPAVIGDFQHVNTNIFVLAAVVGHLWLARRGRDVGAGVLLALGICLKMTPALFAAYWLYQRNWRLLGGLLTALAVMVVGIPLAAVGPRRYDVLMGTWLSNLIVPGLLKGVPYPIHVNQSLSGLFSRLFMHGNIFFNPDDNAVASKERYINVLSLSPAAGRYVLLGLKLVLVAVMAWAIGWRKLPRDDGRRALHYGLVCAAILLLNQRTWDHHAAILLPAYVAMWYALAYGRLGRRTRAAALWGTLLAGAITWLKSGSLLALLGGEQHGKALADLVEAYGPMCLHFLVVFVVCVVLLRGLRRAQPYREGLVASPGAP